MDERRAQWLRFYEIALGGLCADPNMTTDIALAAERIADAAMLRLDARKWSDDNERGDHMGGG